MPAILGLLLMASGCSLKSQGRMQKIRINLPASSGRSLVKPANATTSAMIAPTNLNDFTCYGVKVTGSGITDDSRMGCSPPDGVGIVGGLVPATGGSVELMVPTGPARQIVVFGVQSSEGCDSMDEILNRPASSRFVNFGSFYSLGATTVDITDDTTVTVKIAFSGSGTQIFSGCPGYARAVPTQAGRITVSSGALAYATGGTGSSQVTANLILGSPVFIPGGAAAGGTGSSQVTWKKVDKKGNPW